MFKRLSESAQKGRFPRDDADAFWNTQNLGKTRVCSPKPLPYELLKRKTKLVHLGCIERYGFSTWNSAATTGATLDGKPAVIW